MREQELSNVDVVVYALFKLGGHERKLHTEEIAYEAYQLARERFGWRLKEFRTMGFPDKEPVRIALMDGAKEKYGRLVEGRAGVEAKGKETDGWMLTPLGAAWIRENQKRIEQALGATRPQFAPTQAERFRKQITAQPLFEKFIQRNDLAGESTYALKFARLQASAELLNDPVITRFLAACTKAFPHLLK